MNFLKWISQYLVMSVGLWFCAASVNAQSITPQDIPEDLRAWQPWVMFEHKTAACPFLYNQFDKRLCAWPTQLTLNVDTKRMAFAQQWQVFNRSWIILPGDATQWPQNVRVNGEPYPVLPHQNQPAVELLAGNYVIEGEIFFAEKPASLQIPPNTGWVNLVVNGQKNNAPQWDADGRLWLTAQGGAAQSNGQANIPTETTVRVFRKMIQTVPFEILTLIELDVSNEAELHLGPVNVIGTEALRIDSPLPVQLDQNGFLRVQARPGTWQLSILSRTLTPPTTLKRPTTQEGAWPTEEIWTLSGDQRLGLMTIAGVPRVDPTQTNLPEAWRKLPAYRVLPQDGVQVQQTNVTAAPNNRLQFNREMWLDFAGQNYTIKDVITGEMLSQWRLSLLPPFTLGHVTANNINQLITVEEDKQGQPVRGVEVRSGQLMLEAISQVNNELTLPATGWDQDFDSAQIMLHLPPGWQLFTALGVDKVSTSWLENFTLFDIFMIAVISASLGLLLGKRWGLLAVVMFLLIYPLPYAPRWLWLNIAVILVLLPWFPNMLQKGGRFYRDFSMIALTLCTGIFCLMALRVAIFPQLNPEPPHILTQLWHQLAQNMPSWATTHGNAMYKSNKAMIFAEPENDVLEKTPGRPMTRGKAERAPELTTPVDAKTQTGPAIPTWEGTQVRLSWVGSVSSQQDMRLILISPMATRLLAVLQVVLTVLLCIRLWRIREEKPVALQNLFKNSNAKMMMWLMVCLLGVSALPQQTYANDYPPTEILQTLEQRLLTSPSCLPNCASLANAQLEMAQDNTFKLEMQMETTEAVAVPIPRGNTSWIVTQILLDGQVAPGVASEGAQLLFQLPPGVHRVTILGQVLTPQQMNLDFPLKPYQMQINAPGWQMEGLVGQQLQGRGLVLKRTDEIVQTTTAATSVISEIQPFVQVTRRLSLGLTGVVETQVQRLTPVGDAIHIAIPLLPHETVITPDISLHNGRVQVNLAPMQTDTTWRSTLTNYSDVTLLAPKTSDWVEIWQLNIDPVWHAMITGIPPLAETAYQVWEPIWRPWPGESIHVQLMRLPAAPGATMTIDSAELLNYVSDRNTDGVLNLQLRTTLGGQQRLILPDDAQVQTLTINGLPQVPMLEKNQLTVTLLPGENLVRLRFETPSHAGIWVTSSMLGFDLPLANITQGITLPTDRWVWLAGGSGIGPGMLFWGMVLLLVLASIILAQTHWLPLKTWQFFILGLGILMISPKVAALWLLAAVLLGWRARQPIREVSVLAFRAQQVGWLLLFVLALAGVAFAIQQTLAGTPAPWLIRSDLPQSTLADWVWFQDIAAAWPRVWVISTPLWVYRVVILVWSLVWVLFLLRTWPWVWKTLTQNGVWRPNR